MSNRRKKEWEAKNRIKVDVSQETKSILGSILSEISGSIERSYEKKYLSKKAREFSGKEPGE